VEDLKQTLMWGQKPESPQDETPFRFGSAESTAEDRSPRHRLLQYFTSSQTRSHFFRHVKFRLQTGQVFSGNGFFMDAPRVEAFMISESVNSGPIKQA
jgi:hypothetical protein